MQLAFEGYSTSYIRVNATEQDVKSALEDLDVSVASSLAAQI